MSTETEKQEVENQPFKPNYDYLKTKEMTIEDFFNTIFVGFGWYRAYQRIPKLDTLNETQRKAIWAMIKKRNVKKKKLTTVQADINIVSGYHHGDNSVYTVLNNLIAEHKNNMPLFSPDGSFGSRSNDEAAAPRYTETRLLKTMDLVFPMENIIAMRAERTVDNKPAEPHTLFPIVPIGLINGQNQTSVGFGCNLLPRNPIKIIELVGQVLKGELKKYPAYIMPSFPFFHGEIDYNGNNQYEFKGKIEKYKRGQSKKLIITEVPPEVRRNKYIEFLNKLKKDKVITKYTEDIVKHTFRVEIWAPELWDKSEEELLKIFGLVATSTDKFTYIDRSDRFEIECNTIGKFINFFIVETLKIYTARKNYMLSKIRYTLMKKIATLNYIKEANAKRIDPRGTSEEEIITQLESYDPSFYFKPMVKTFVWGEDPYGANADYDYLFDFKVRNFTPKKVASLTKEIQDLQADYQKINALTPQKIWLEDLDKLREHLMTIGWNSDEGLALKPKKRKRKA